MDLGAYSLTFAVGGVAYTNCATNRSQAACVNNTCHEALLSGWAQADHVLGMMGESIGMVSPDFRLLSYSFVKIGMVSPDFRFPTDFPDLGQI
jgi:hypothetical protein